jgi:hypothetical protein
MSGGDPQAAEAPTIYRRFKMYKNVTLNTAIHPVYGKAQPR